MLDERWSAWLGDATIDFQSNPGHVETTIMIVRLDQAALRGVLNRIFDLNLTLLSACRLDSPMERTAHDER
jgi:hypothetical protein